MVSISLNIEETIFFYFFDLLMIGLIPTAINNTTNILNNLSSNIYIL